MDGCVLQSISLDIISINVFFSLFLYSNNVFGEGREVRWGILIGTGASNSQATRGVIERHLLLLSTDELVPPAPAILFIILSCNLYFN